MVLTNSVSAFLFKYMHLFTISLSDKTPEVSLLSFFIMSKPIVKNDTLEGVISIGDVLKRMLELKEFEIKNLSGYISGQY